MTTTKQARENIKKQEDRSKHTKHIAVKDPSTGKFVTLKVSKKTGKLTTEKSRDGQFINPLKRLNPQEITKQKSSNTLRKPITKPTQINPKYNKSNTTALKQKQQQKVSYLTFKERTQFPNMQKQFQKFRQDRLSTQYGLNPLQETYAFTQKRKHKGLIANTTTTLQNINQFTSVPRERFIAPIIRGAKKTNKLTGNPLYIRESQNAGLFKIRKKKYTQQQLKYTKYANNIIKNDSDIQTFIHTIKITPLFFIPIVRAITTGYYGYKGVQDLPSAITSTDRLPRKAGRIAFNLLPILGLRSIHKSYKLKRLKKQLENEPILATELDKFTTTTKKTSKSLRGTHEKHRIFTESNIKVKPKKYPRKSGKRTNIIDEHLFLRFKPKTTQHIKNKVIKTPDGTTVVMKEVKPKITQSSHWTPKYQHTTTTVRGPFNTYKVLAKTDKNGITQYKIYITKKYWPFKTYKRTHLAAQGKFKADKLASIKEHLEKKFEAIKIQQDNKLFQMQMREHTYEIKPIKIIKTKKGNMGLQGEIIINTRDKFTAEPIKVNPIGDLEIHRKFTYTPHKKVPYHLRARYGQEVINEFNKDLTKENLNINFVDNQQTYFTKAGSIRIQPKTTVFEFGDIHYQPPKRTKIYDDTIQINQPLDPHIKQKTKVTDVDIKLGMKPIIERPYIKTHYKEHSFKSKPEKYTKLLLDWDGKVWNNIKFVPSKTKRKTVNTEEITNNNLKILNAEKDLLAQLEKKYGKTIKPTEEYINTNQISQAINKPEQYTQKFIIDKTKVNIPKYIWSSEIKKLGRNISYKPFLALNNIEYIKNKHIKYMNNTNLTKNELKNIQQNINTLKNIQQNITKNIQIVKNLSKTQVRNIQKSINKSITTTLAKTSTKYIETIKPTTPNKITFMKINPYKQSNKIPFTHYKKNTQATSYQPVYYKNNPNKITPGPVFETPQQAITQAKTDLDNIPQHNAKIIKRSDIHSSQLSTPIKKPNDHKFVYKNKILQEKIKYRKDKPGERGKGFDMLGLIYGKGITKARS